MLTKRQAAAEARKRWGERAAVKREKPGRMKALGGPHKGLVVCMTCYKPDCTARFAYVVGRITYFGGIPFAFSVEGNGHSWKEAFEKSERKTKTK